MGATRWRLVGLKRPVVRRGVILAGHKGHKYHKGGFCLGSIRHQIFGDENASRTYVWVRVEVVNAYLLPE